MPEPVIINATVIQVKSTTKDTYGNLIVTPEVGEDIKIGVKRENLFEVFQEGRAVKLYWAEYMHKKYVARAELFDGLPPVEKRIKPITAGVEVEPLSPVVVKEHKSSPETGMWWKELGDMLRAGDIDKTKPEGKLMRIAYYSEMMRVLNIKIEQKGG